jgi:K+-transporting ATPase ATPase C chain
VLLLVTFVLCSVLYPLVLLGIGQAFFRHKAQGSLIDAQGQPVTDPAKAVGSRLIAQPFTGDEYFWPRPSAVGYHGAASGASNWGASNHLLRERVARQLGPIVRYRNGPNRGQLVGPDIEAWFQKDRSRGKPGIVAQWAEAHPTVARRWVTADQMHGDYVVAWQNTHADEVAKWIKANLTAPNPQPEDLAVPFFQSYSNTFPGTFPVALVRIKPGGQTEKRIDPAKEGVEIQGIFFDMWRVEHPNEDLEDVPADMVMASGSGLDPHITLKNALYQLPRVAARWVDHTKRNPDEIRREIENLLHQKAEAPLGGLVGLEMVNVLEVNLALRQRFGTPASP